MALFMLNLMIALLNLTYGRKSCPVPSDMTNQSVKIGYIGSYARVTAASQMTRFEFTAGGVAFAIQNFQEEGNFPGYNFT